MFVFDNPHPEQKRVGDCIKRSIVIATGINYRDITIMLNRWKKLSGDRDYWKSFIETVLGGHKNKGDMQHEFYGRRYTVKEFASYWNPKTAILRCAGHLVTCKNGDYYDTWDSGEKGVYIAWFIDDYVKIVNRIESVFPKLCKGLTLERRKVCLR